MSEQQRLFEALSLACKLVCSGQMSASEVTTYAAAFAHFLLPKESAAKKIRKPVRK